MESLKATKAATVLESPKVDRKATASMAPCLRLAMKRPRRSRPRDSLCRSRLSRTSSVHTGERPALDLTSATLSPSSFSALRAVRAIRPCLRLPRFRVLDGLQLPSAVDTCDDDQYLEHRRLLLLLRYCLQAQCSDRHYTSWRTRQITSLVQLRLVSYTLTCFR